MKVVIVDNGGQFTHLEGRALRDVGVDHEIVENDADPDEVVQRADALVLSGGPSIEDVGRTPEYLDSGLPILGICLGHQLIARQMGGEVEPGDHGGYADVEIEVTEDGGLFEGLPDSFSAWASHADEVVELPDGFVKTARSDVSEVEAMRHRDRAIYGVQFHPEVSQTEHGLEIFENFVELAREAQEPATDNPATDKSSVDR